MYRNFGGTRAQITCNLFKLQIGVSKKANTCSRNIVILRRYAGIGNEKLRSIFHVAKWNILRRKYESLDRATVE